MQKTIRFSFLYVLLLQLIIGCDDGTAKWPFEQFDRAKWAQTDEKNRFEYVRDLIDKQNLLGKSKEEIITLLGAPSYDRPDGTDAVYIVKVDSGLVHVIDFRFQEIGRKMIVSKVLSRSD